MADALETAQFDLRWFYSAVGSVKKFTPQTCTYSGNDYKIYVDSADGFSGAKKMAVHTGVRAVVNAGFSLPDDIRFYLTCSVEAQNRAFHFDANGNYISWISLGIAAMSGGSGTGISAQSTPGFDSCAKVVIHETGHSLHAHKVGSVEEFFKPASDGRWKGKVDGASDVSGYAAGNKKEFVAEFFLGSIIGRKYSQALKDAYIALDGPTVPGFI